MKIKKIPLQFWIFGKGTYFTNISVMSIENGVVYVYFTYVQPVLSVSLRL